MSLLYPFFTTENILISGKSVPAYLFNVFPCELFKQLTSINEVFLDIEYQGEGLLEINFIESEKQKTCRAIPLQHTENFQLISIPLAFDLWKAMYVVLSGYDKIKIRKFSLRTERIQDKKLSLGIVVCTFKKEEYIKKLIESVNFCDLSFESELTIIDNGNSNWPPIESKIPIRVLPNRNLGGAGGFTRGIREVIKNPNLTHILLMDDDIHLEPLLLNRLAFFLSLQSNANTLISGGMYDIIKPYVLYEANTQCSINKFGYIAALSNLDLKKQADFQKQFTWTGADFAPWWFAAFPVSAVKEIGLPLPLFIRGDDLEYGLRMKKNGYQVINFPGVGVWHEPFYVKNPAWIYFYHIRNFFIINAIHRNIREFNAVFFLSLRIILNLISYKYNQAEQMLDGWEQYLEGPDDFLKKKPEEIHTTVLRKVSNDPDCKISLKEDISSINTSNHRIMRWSKEWNLIKIPFVFFFKHLEINIKERSTFEVYSRNLIRGIRIFLRLTVLICLWFTNRKKVSRNWELQFPYFISESFWKKYSHA